ncbi:alpha amylase C-terminal domain-containing protein [Schlegelella sp. S2-27]|uniref:Alpha-amylase n=1 Tax=Caldimonas mangrovi TaxID=2944811 RepID=A0ABT0YI55_9BURK|nr:carbohydrate-binding module family 20 domain-containing protein [Caldimonas mangrovi]MCM5678390.1 alpha amylase C-terminal domain-containing protein [Caldimonas mangrovi]
MQRSSNAPRQGLIRPFPSFCRQFALVLATSATLAGSWAPGAAQAQTTARTAFVHLFEWKWTDVAKECETYLGPKGFAAVQVSPPNEHHWVTSGDGAPYPWWMRYQPVSYHLDRSRSGTRAEFQDMVNRCNAAGVGIYVDAVINHMSGGNGGTSSAGRSWSHHNYPGLYGSQDFHQPVCSITNYGDANNVQNCELSGLQDLNTGSSYVRAKIADYLVDLASMGVKGFRVDAAKHISPGDLGAIIDNVNSRTGANKPFWFLEVIGAAGEAVQPSQYFALGNSQVTVTEFSYGKELYGKFAGGGKLADLQSFGPSWNLMPSSKAVAFVDNHDKQRGHGGGGGYVTYHHGSTYDLANIFMLAWPYGYPALMSSYGFNRSSSYDTSYGPPHYSDGATKGPWDGNPSSPACFDPSVGGWVCEHRWRGIGNMVAFRNATVDNWFVSDWWSNGNNQIAFGRGDKGFVVINKEGNALTRSFKTSLPAGQYCDVISGDFNNGTCTGSIVTVDAGGYAMMSAPANGAAAVHVGARIGDQQPGGYASISFNVTASTVWGQNVFVVGNVAALGNWTPTSAAAMTWLSGSGSTGHWRATVQLPANTSLQYKYIKRDGAGNVVWESGSNRIVTTPAPGAATAVNDAWQ